MSFQTTSVVRNSSEQFAVTILPMNLLRFFMLLALSVWLGSLIFFPVVAQISFSTLPSAHLAGMVVRSSLIALHWIGLGAGVLFLTCSLAESRLACGRFSAFRSSHWLVLLMLALTSISQFHLIPRMDALRSAAGEINQLPASDPILLQFNHLHAWSVRLETAVLALGIAGLYLTTRRLGQNR